MFVMFQIGIHMGRQRKRKMLQLDSSSSFASSNYTESSNITSSSDSSLETNGHRKRKR